MMGGGTRPECPACGRLGFCYWAYDSWICTRCAAEWSTRSGFLTRVGPVTDAQRATIEADAERSRRRSREACPHCHGRHDPAETGNPMCGWCLDGYLADHLGQKAVTTPPGATCEWCRSPITRAGSVGRPTKFCSPSHRQQAYQQRRFDRLLADHLGRQP